MFTKLRSECPRNTKPNVWSVHPSIQCNKSSGFNASNRQSIPSWNQCPLISTQYLHCFKGVGLLGRLHPGSFNHEVCQLTKNSALMRLLTQDSLCHHSFSQTWQGFIFCTPPPRAFPSPTISTCTLPKTKLPPPSFYIAFFVCITTPTLLTQCASTILASVCPTTCFLLALSLPANQHQAYRPSTAQRWALCLPDDVCV